MGTQDEENAKSVIEESKQFIEEFQSLSKGIGKIEDKKNEKCHSRQIPSQTGCSSSSAKAKTDPILSAETFKGMV